MEIILVIIGIIVLLCFLSVGGWILEILSHLFYFSNACFFMSVHDRALRQTLILVDVQCNENFFEKIAPFLEFFRNVSILYMY